MANESTTWLPSFALMATRWRYVYFWWHDDCEPDGKLLASSPQGPLGFLQLSIQKLIMRYEIDYLIFCWFTCTWLWWRPVCNSRRWRSTWPDSSYSVQSQGNRWTSATIKSNNHSPPNQKFMANKHISLLISTLVSTTISAKWNSIKTWNETVNLLAA